MSEKPVPEGPHTNPSTEEYDPNTPFYDDFDYGHERAMAIALPTVLEKLLERHLRIRMVPDKTIAAEFFRPSGPLGNYGAKVRMAYMLRIIDKYLYDDLLTISKIRNKFAHSLETKTFEDPTIKQWIFSMKAFETLKAMADASLTGTDLTIGCLYQ